MAVKRARSCGGVTVPSESALRHGHYKAGEQMETYSKPTELSIGIEG